MIQTKDDGSPLLCKFCRRPVWMDEPTRRVFEPGGVGLHVVNCPDRRKWFKDRAFSIAEESRQRRMHPLDAKACGLDTKRRRKRKPTQPATRGEEE